MAAAYSGVTWIDPGGGLGGWRPPVGGTPSSSITFWNASGYCEMS